MKLATLELELLANIARLRKDMDEAKGVVDKATKAISASVNAAMGVLGALGIGLSVAAFSAWVKSAIDAGDAMKAFSQKTGVAVKDVAGLQLAFQQGGVEGDRLQSAIAKMSKSMAESSESFQRLGVETRNADGSLRDAKSVLYDVADATAKMKDGTEKVVALQAIFGKSAADLIPTLNDGSEGLRAMAEMAERLGLAMSAETADAADRFNDTTELLGMGLQGVSRQVAAELLPTLTNLTGVMLETASNGQTVNAVAGAISGTLKTLFSVGVGVSEVFSTLGKTLGAAGAALVSMMNGDFASAKVIMSEWKQEVSTDWQESGAKIQKVWSEATDTTVAAMAEMNSAANETTAGISKTTKAYDQLSQKLMQRNAQLKSELDQNAKLTASQKILIDLTNKSTAAYKSLTDVERAELIEKARQNVALEKEALARAEARKQKEAEEKALVKLIEKTREGNRSLDEQIAAQRAANDSARMGVEASAALEIAKLREAAATAQKNAITATEQQHNKELAAQYQAQADKLRELADLKEQGIHIQSAKDAAEEWKKTTDSIQNGLTDSLMRGFESGKSFSESFRDGLVAQFKALVLQPTIQAIMGPVSGAMGNVMGSLLGGQGGQGSLGGMSSLASLFKVGGTFGATGSLAGGIGGGISSFGGMVGSSTMQQFGGGMTAGYGNGSVASGLGAKAGSAVPWVAGVGGGLLAGRAISGEYSVGNTIGGNKNTAVVVGTAIGSIWGPIGAALGGAIGGFFNRAFGMGEKKIKESGIQGTISGGAATGQTYANWKQKGGWFRSDKSGVNYADIQEDMAQAMDAGSKAVLSQVEVWAQVLKLPGEKLASVTSSFKIALGEDEAANQEAVAKVFIDYQNALAARYGTVLKQFQKAGESFSDTMSRLAGLQQFSAAFNEFGGVFSRIASLSVDAREQLIGFAGGIDALIGKTQSFVDAYYSDSEKAGLQSKQVAGALKELGFDTSALQNRDQYRALVERQEVETEAGRKIFNALLDIAPVFASLTGYLGQNNLTLDQSAAQAPQTALLQSLFDESKLNAADMVDQQVLANDNLMSIEDAVRSGNRSIIDAVMSSGGFVSDAIVRAISSSAAPASRAVVEA